MRRPLRSLTLPLIPLALSAGCGGEQRGDPDLQVRLEVAPDPPTPGIAALTIDVSDVDWRPRNDDRVIVRALQDEVVMAVDTAVGHGAGRYVVEALPLPVAGDWLLTVRVETRTGAWAELDRRLRVADDEGR